MCSSFFSDAEPWNIMCSNRCANPVRPLGSTRKPMLYMTSTSTTGAVWSGLTTTFSPLGSVKYSSGTVKAGGDGTCAASGVATAMRASALAATANRTGMRRLLDGTGDTGETSRGGVWFVTAGTVRGTNAVRPGR